MEQDHRTLEREDVLNAVQMGMGIFLSFLL